MAQPPQTEATDCGANVAQLGAAQKLLYADAIAPVHKQTLTVEILLWGFNSASAGTRTSDVDTRDGQLWLSLQPDIACHLQPVVFDR